MKTLCFCQLLVWPLLATWAMAQDVTAPSRADASSTANRQGETGSSPGITINESEFNFHANTAHVVWNSLRQLNDYYLRNYIGSSGYTFSSGGAMWRPDLRLDKTFCYLQGQELTVNGAKVTVVEAFSLDKLEVIGIARHDAPVAYTVNRHSSFNPNPNRGPNSYDASNPVKVSGERPLTDFEKSSLARIHAGEETTSQRQVDGSLVIVGKIPAQDACLQCHTGYKSGDALGAFSYHLGQVNLFDNLPLSTDAHASAAPVSTSAGP